MLYDKDIREPLFDFLEERFGKIRIIEEKRMGRSRADILMVLEGAVMGLEIKSDADTYVRLSRQVRDYDRYCDGNYVDVYKRQLYALRGDEPLSLRLFSGQKPLPLHAGSGPPVHGASVQAHYGAF